MTAGERVVFALKRRGEGAQTVQLTVRAERLAPTRENLMAVCLMTYVPDEEVVRGVIDIVKGNGQLGHSQRRGEVTGVYRQLFYNVFTQFPADLRQLSDTQTTQVGGVFYLVQKTEFLFIHAVPVTNNFAKIMLFG